MSRRSDCTSEVDDQQTQSGPAERSEQERDSGTASQSLQPKVGKGGEPEREGGDQEDSQHSGRLYEM